MFQIECSGVLLIEYSGMLLIEYSADLPTVLYFPGQYQKYKPCPSVPNVCSKIPDFDGPGYGVKYLCATRKRDRPDRVNCV